MVSYFVKGVSKNKLIITKGSMVQGYMSNFPKYGSAFNSCAK